MSLNLANVIIFVDITKLSRKMMRKIRFIMKQIYNFNIILLIGYIYGISCRISRRFFSEFNILSEDVQGSISDIKLPHQKKVKISNL